MTAESDDFKGFVGCTLVRMQEEFKGWKRIDEIKVGDMVMAVPKNGVGEAVAKPVTNICNHQDHAVWYVGIAEYESGIGEISDNLACTAGQLFCVYGYAPEVSKYAVHNPIDFYDTPKWKRVDELLVGDVLMAVVEQDYHLVCSVKPFSKNKREEYAWLQGGKDMTYWQEDDTGSRWIVDNVDTFMPPIDGHIIEVGKKRENEKYQLSQKAKPTPLYDYDGITDEMQAGNKYEPYTTSVYNIEVADHHTYGVGISGMAVHDMQS